jgi:hypothetical protein
MKVALQDFFEDGELIDVLFPLCQQIFPELPGNNLHGGRLSLTSIGKCENSIVITARFRNSR